MKRDHHRGEKSKESMVGRKWENNTRIQSINQSNVPGEWLLLPSWGTIVRIIINSIIIVIVSIAMMIINVMILIKYEADIVLKFRIFGQPWNTDLTGSLSQYFQTLGSVHQRTPGFKTPSTPEPGWSSRSDSWTSFQAPMFWVDTPGQKDSLNPLGPKRDILIIRRGQRAQRKHKDKDKKTKRYPHHEEGR